MFKRFGALVALVCFLSAVPVFAHDVRGRASDPGLRDRDSYMIVVRIIKAVKKGVIKTLSDELVTPKP